jgi:hypothetical protein
MSRLTLASSGVAAGDATHEVVVAWIRERTRE